MSRFASCALLALLLGLPGAAAEPPSPATARGWVDAMKRSQKGPFQRIRWYCNDGTVQPPKAYACRGRGGGVQHGEWNAQARALREAGWRVANVLASVDAGAFVGPEADLDGLKQILLERFLIGWDDGWIFRGARTYRGALQAEDEEAGARRITEALLTDPLWRAPERYFLLREAVRLLPLDVDASSASTVRATAVVIAEKDPGFADLRAKIHNQPDGDDAERVRAYARERGKPELAALYEEQAAGIDALYQGSSAEKLAELAGRIEDAALKQRLQRGAERLAADPPPPEVVAEGSELLALLRDALARGVREPATALLLLQASLALETELFGAGNELLDEMAPLTRRERLELVGRTSVGLYGVGFLSGRQRDEVARSLARLEGRRDPTLERYRGELRLLARSSEWSSRWIAFHFETNVERLAQLDPEVRLYAQDRVRASPLRLQGAVTDGLTADANRLAGIRHRLFGRDVGTGLRALNPGLARGSLRSAGAGGVEADPDGIYLLPETTAELGRIAGILTRGEGSSLSHVQLLARNLGIPNVVVGTRLLEGVESRTGQRVVLAASPGGVVQLEADGPRWEEILGRESSADELVIRPDLDKLDLDSVRILGLEELRATDSGRTSGPKGANLGELKHHFGDKVPDGVVIPFGVFRRVLDQPLEPGGPKLWDWMVESYDEIARTPEGPERTRRVSAFLSRLRGQIRAADIGPKLRSELRQELERRFGADGSWGAFVRSDTNVEDLPGFTGAGLNLTLFNVVGVDDVIEAIGEVWASPFTERAYGWRQANMKDPEYVMPAVVIQRAYPSAKSGVMVTLDVDTGDRKWLTVAASEGVGGAVEGQAAESLKIRADGSEVRLEAQATAPERTVLLPEGGVGHVPASGTSAVLQEAEIAQLVELARSVSRFPSLRDERGRSLPADIEFAFGQQGNLVLLQMRPLVESRKARRSAYLRELDQAFASRSKRRVPLGGIPEASAALAAAD